MARFFIVRPIFAWVIAILILLIGFIALKQLPVAQYPQVAPPQVAFNVKYPGASAELIENTVISLIEQEMNGIERLLYMEASSELGAGTLTLTFEPGTNIDTASVEAQNRYKRIEARLPEEVRRLGVPVTKPQRNYLMFIALYSEDGSRDAIELGSFMATRVLDPIRRVPGVGEAILFGTEYSMRIWLQPDKLLGFGITPSDVRRALQAQNVQLATGELNQAPAAAGAEINAVIVTQGRLKTVDEFGNVAIRTLEDGSTVRVRDIARVELGGESYARYARLGGQPISAIAVRVAPGANALDVAQRLKVRMAELESFFPEGVGWTIPYDTSRFVEISIFEVVKTLGEAMLLVFVVMFVFLGHWRTTLIPAVVVPVSLAGAIAGLYAFGFSINVLTLFAMVLAIGILVDDAIVVVENVERIMREEHLAPLPATVKAMDQILGAILGISVVLSVVFMPMLFFGGSVGAIYQQFAATLILTMAFSVFMALSLTPAMCATLLKRSEAEHDQERRFNQFFDRLTLGYRDKVRTVLGRRGAFFALYLGLVALTGGLFSQLPGSFLPDEDQGYLITAIQLPGGATQERTVAVLEQVEQFYAAQPEVDKVIGVVGFSFFGSGQNAAIVFTRLKDWSERTQPNESVQAIIGRAFGRFMQIPDALIFAINPPPIPELGAVGGFDFRLQDRSGQGRDALLKVRDEVLNKARADARLSGIRGEGQGPSPQLYLDIDRDKAQALQISIAELNDTLSAAIGVSYINDFERDGRILRVQMQADAELRRTPQDLLALPIRNQRDEIVALAEIAVPRWTTTLPKLDRYNGNPSTKIAGNPAPGHSTGEAMQAMEEIAQTLPPGYAFEWSGTSFEERQAGAQAPTLFALSLLVVILALAALYESWSVPFAVILVVPLGILGAVLAVELRGLPNDVFFKVGLIAIIGLAAKNAILIVEFARKLQDEGRDLMDATLEASRLRLRPILMTSFAFIGGVLPLALSTGAGAAGRNAVGTGVVGGMLAATFLAIFFVPLFYALVRQWFPHKPQTEIK
ncbi:MAG: multidrug efflux RND transporter permease subunit [Gammaproteobacteria bacterium]